MKRTERHHLKENEIQLLTRQARQAVEERRREVTWGLGAVAIIAVVAIGYFVWRQNVDAKAHTLLADAMVAVDARVVPPTASPAPGAPGAPAAPTPPTAGTYPSEQARAEVALVKLKAAADAYPSTKAGIFARYQQASMLMTLGRFPEAVTCYDEVIKHAGDGIYAQTSRLGLAEAHARAGQYDQAINAYKELAQRKDGPLPTDGILMQLGRTYLDAGKRADAQQTFNRLVDEYPESPYTAEARQQLDALKKT
jgi:TolA-binding protein